MRRQLLLAAIAFTTCLTAQAQEAVAPPPTTVAAPAAVRDNLPNLNIYLPDGEFDIRIRKLIKNVLLESQINYKFVDGDISTFLRYKYYARSFTYKIGVFDSLEFASVQSGSGDFDRIRGGLLLLERPVNYNTRYFWLFQDDGLTFGDVTKPDNKHNNLYTKVAFQYGTPFDERLNSIVGESRGRITPVLTAYREIGPQNRGFAVAVTQALSSVGGDYQYTKFETEGLQRIDLTETSFIFSRLHVGSFLQKSNRCVATADSPACAPFDPARPQYERYDVPRYEFFKLGGRDALKGVDDRNRGSDEIHLSNELFVPVFRNRSHRFFGTRWNSLYGTGYVGTGSVGFSSKTFTQISDYVVDAGVGFEANLTVRNYDVYLTTVYAQTVRAPQDLKGHEIRFSVRTSR
ncbi:MAG TPA: hypothetical protein VHL58_02480 [Thermoanaerobaculia bacterium]|nr:hypothetical protein [Thermoanaerobaculia bacterium]